MRRKKPWASISAKKGVTWSDVWFNYLWNIRIFYNVFRVSVTRYFIDYYVSKLHVCTHSHIHELASQILLSVSPPRIRVLLTSFSLWLWHDDDVNSIHMRENQKSIRFHYTTHSTSYICDSKYFLSLSSLRCLLINGLIYKRLTI